VKIYLYLFITSTQFSLQAMTVIYSKFIHNFFIYNACIIMIFQTNTNASNLLTKLVETLLFYFVQCFLCTAVKKKMLASLACTENSVELRNMWK
jgi:hypothetical protein